MIASARVSSISALPDFRRLMRLAAARVGQVLNQSTLARDAALPQPTRRLWLNLPETSLQIVRIPAEGARGAGHCPACDGKDSAGLEAPP